MLESVKGDTSRAVSLLVEINKREDRVRKAQQSPQDFDAFVQELRTENPYAASALQGNPDLLNQPSYTNPEQGMLWFRNGAELDTAVSAIKANLSPQQAAAAQRLIAAGFSESNVYQILSACEWNEETARRLLQSGL